MVFERGYEASQPALKRASISKPYLVVEKVDMVEKICVKNPNKSNKKLQKLMYRRWFTNYQSKNLQLMKKFKILKNLKME